MIRAKRRRVYYLKREMHFQVANVIAKRYDLFMMPKLPVGKLTERATRRLKTKTARSLLNLGHAQLFDTIQDKCWEQGKHFLQVREEYTSQTCPCCGHLNKCNEVYLCKDCGFRHDRDIVGALNILLKSIRTTNPALDLSAWLGR